MARAVLRSLESAIKEWNDAPSFVLYMIVLSAILSQVLFNVIDLPFGLLDLSNVPNEIRLPSTDGLSQYGDRLGQLFDKIPFDDLRDFLRQL